MKKVIFLLFLTVFCAGIGKGLYFLKDGFSPRRIQTLDIPLGNWGKEDWDEEAGHALSQPFLYLGRGRQCFAFLSADGQYVLKFMRADIYKTPFWARALPLQSYREKMEIIHRNREQFVIGSFDISFHELRTQTGLVALHVGPSDSKKKLILIDPLGIKHCLPLGQTSFVLQHKIPNLTSAFTRALEMGNRKEAQKILDAFVDVVIERGKKKILNKDNGFMGNYGYDGQRAYHIDVGSFYRKPDASYQRSVQETIRPVQEWIANIDPEMQEYLNQKLNTTLRSL